jgi:hypothetical protein
MLVASESIRQCAVSDEAGFWLPQLLQMRKMRRHGPRPEASVDYGCLTTLPNVVTSILRLGR